MNALLVSSSILTLTSAGLLGLAIPAHISNYRALLRLRAAQRHANSHVQKSRLELMETRNRARLLEDTVKQGTSAVEKMHQAIATTTFSLIDHFARDEEFRESARRARDTHHDTSRKVYQAARTTNKAIHLLADSLIISRKEKKLTTQGLRKVKKQ
ncbi:hypothetical protein [Marinobacter sp. CHS3-4]|uniref:hypothetical protein n=1 Tax=Marinobacter sp. CHS3-4 TaxID=3045174 RepID=UPI0024B62DFD|nr:hypothetical protein [Marinobacter sp. CHS3-4]MDI9245426.1 hypothetical protein [Marinobacter sp. CHS3-4]